PVDGGGGTQEGPYAVRDAGGKFQPRLKIGSRSRGWCACPSQRGSLKPSILAPTWCIPGSKHRRHTAEVGHLRLCRPAIHTSHRHGTVPTPSGSLTFPLSGAYNSSTLAAICRTQPRVHTIRTGPRPGME